MSLIAGRRQCGVGKKSSQIQTRHDHYPVCWLDIQQDSEFATGYGYPKLLSNGNRIRIRITQTLLSMFRGFRLLEKVAHCAIIHSLSSEASFQQPSVP